MVGGGIANTFLKATGKNVGKSLCEDDLIPTAKMLMDKMAKRQCLHPYCNRCRGGKEIRLE